MVLGTKCSDALLRYCPCAPSGRVIEDAVWESPDRPSCRRSVRATTRGPGGGQDVGLSRYRERPHTKHRLIDRAKALMRCANRS